VIDKKGEDLFLFFVNAKGLLSQAATKGGG
jgi:hypothetical protein